VWLWGGGQSECTGLHVWMGGWDALKTGLTEGKSKSELRGWCCYESRLVVQGHGWFCIQHCTSHVIYVQIGLDTVAMV
jgi:hypothetical protein